jgi:hypothetical protein
VQAALNAAAAGIGGGHDPHAGGGEGGVDLGVGDRGARQLGEPGQLRLGARRKRSARDPTSMTPRVKRYPPVRAMVGNRELVTGETGRRVTTRDLPAA